MPMRSAKKYIQRKKAEIMEKVTKKSGQDSQHATDRPKKDRTNAQHPEDDGHQSDEPIQGIIEETRIELHHSEDSTRPNLNYRQAVVFGPNHQRNMAVARPSAASTSSIDGPKFRNMAREPISSKASSFFQSLERGLPKMMRKPRSTSTPEMPLGEVQVPPRAEFNQPQPLIELHETSTPRRQRPTSLDLTSINLNASPDHHDQRSSGAQQWTFRTPTPTLGATWRRMLNQDTPRGFQTVTLTNPHLVRIQTSTNPGHVYVTPMRFPPDFSTPPPPIPERMLMLSPVPEVTSIQSTPNPEATSIQSTPNPEASTNEEFQLQRTKSFYPTLPLTDFQDVDTGLTENDTEINDDVGKDLIGGNLMERLNVQSVLNRDDDQASDSTLYRSVASNVEDSGFQSFHTAVEDWPWSYGAYVPPDTCPDLPPPPPGSPTTAVSTTTAQPFTTFTSPRMTTPGAATGALMPPFAASAPTLASMTSQALAGPPFAQPFSSPTQPAFTTDTTTTTQAATETMMSSTPRPKQVVLIPFTSTEELVAKAKKHLDDKKE